MRFYPYGGVAHLTPPEGAPHPAITFRISTPRFQLMSLMFYNYCSLSRQNVQPNVHVDNADDGTKNMPDEYMKVNFFCKLGESFLYV